MKVFVTGATGFIGSAIVKGLAGRGHEVAGLVRRKPLAAAVEEAGARPVVGNLLDPASWKAELSECELVISASQPVKFGEGLSVAESHRRSYYHGKMVTNLFNAAQGTKVKGIAVTYGVHGFGDMGEKWAAEFTDLSPVGYERSVSGAFWHIDKTSRKTRVPLLNIFTGLVYGPGGWFEMMARGITNGSWRMAGAGGNHMSMIHIDDLVSAYAAVADRMPLGERVCMVDGSPMTQAEVVGLLAEELGHPMPKAMDLDGYAKHAGELMAEAMSCSVRVSGDKMKKSLLPELKYPSFREGLPALMDKMGMKRGEEPDIRQASGF